MADAITAMIGDNNPPLDLLVGEALLERLRDMHSTMAKRAEELLAAAGRVPAIESDETAGKVSDFIKQLAALIKAADQARVAAKEPYLEGGRNIDGFFKSLSTPVESAKKTAESKLTAYLREKEAKARREREEQERAAREAAEKARLEAEARAAAMKTDADLDAAAAAEKAAEVAEADRIKAQQAAEVKAAELSRTRGEYGSVSSLRTSWVFDGIDRATLDLEALREHFPIDAFEKAIRSFIRAGGRELRGARIFETTSATVR